MTSYYNDSDPFCAAMLQNLIDAGLLPYGHVDPRSIVEVKPRDLEGFKHVHFFAGVGGWPLALLLAGWSPQRSVWTASCPCQPWSRARIRNRDKLGNDDERDLWPVLFELVKACDPVEMYGEQVTGKQVTPWFKRLRFDMEGNDYHVRTDIKKANNHGSPQRRARYYFHAHADGTRRGRLGASAYPSQTRHWRWRGEADCQSIANAPFERGDRWPQPLIRSRDARVPQRVALLRAFGNAIDPYVGADFIYETTQGLKAPGNLMT